MRTTIVTAIPYVNAIPHIGTVLTDLAGDITARYFRMRGDDVFFVAGADENGQKIKEAAEKAGRDPFEFVGEMTGAFQDIFRGMEIDYDEFVRTTENRHKETSQHFFKVLQERGYIYSGTYEGWYDVSTETFFKESDLVDGKSPDGNPVRWVSETNYFFKLSAFEQQLLELIEGNPGFIVPQSRRNEVISFIKQGLRDSAISRQNAGWGIPVPGDENQVIYVWFDALINYVTATGWPNPGWEDKWPPIVQWLGKDILTRFHATMWPAMLMGVGLPVPKTLAAHAWILLGSGEKISKSKGNQIAPLDLAADLASRSGCKELIAVDAVRHYLCSTMPFEDDSTFTYEDFDRRYNNDLANDLGNALNRSLAMAHKFVDGKVPDGRLEPAAAEAIKLAKEAYEAAMEGFRLEQASDAALGLVRFLNKYIDTRAPWALAKTQDPALPDVLYSMLLCLQAVEGLVRPEMPTTADAVASQLGLSPLTSWAQIGSLDSLPVGTALAQPAPLFPRLDLTAATPAPKPKPEPKMETKTESAPVATEIAIDDFAKVQLRVGRVLEAEPLEGADKLLKLQVVIGQEKRQIVAGIRKNYTPEELIGRQVIVVANLKPAKLRGVESQGMLLAAVSEDGGAILLEPEKEAPEGALVR
jgi:methionyl-tRNA synthetase